jgi:hypothetical protein
MRSEEASLGQTVSNNIESTLERLLAPIAEIEKLKRREYLSPEEVELEYGLKVSTLANKRMKAQEPGYIKDGEKILYKQQAVRQYLESRAVKTRY